MSLHYTAHGECRANQRGFTKRMIQLIRECGTLVQDDHLEVVVITQQDVAKAIKVRKAEIQRLEKLGGCKAVFCGDQLLTVHHTGRRGRKALLRRLRDR